MIILHCIITFIAIQTISITIGFKGVIFIALLNPAIHEIDCFSTVDLFIFSMSFSLSNLIKLNERSIIKVNCLNNIKINICNLFSSFFSFLISSSVWEFIIILVLLWVFSYLSVLFLHVVALFFVTWKCFREKIKIQSKV